MIVLDIVHTLVLSITVVIIFDTTLYGYRCHLAMAWASSQQAHLRLNPNRQTEALPPVLEFRVQGLQVRVQVRVTTGMACKGCTRKLS